jgi:exoribonuclease-2
MALGEKYLGSVVEYLDENRLKPGLVVREPANQAVVLDAGGRERSISRDLILVRHSDRTATRDNLSRVLASIEEERARLAAELDLNLMWEVVRDNERGYAAEELAELFFGRRSPMGSAVMLDALFGDRLYFVRRYMEFVPRSAEQVERLRVQYDKMRLRGEEGRRIRGLLRAILEQGVLPSREEAAPLIAELTRYLENPHTRARETTALLEAAWSDVPPAETAYEVLERLGAAPPGPRFALIGGIRTSFSDAALAEAASASPPIRSVVDDHDAITIDDEETVEIDDALSCEPLPDSALRVRVHIALVADFVSRDGAMDTEAAARGATVYLPEATVRMLPDAISTGAASLIAGHDRHVLTTDVRLSPSGEMIDCSIYPSSISVAARLTYDQADRLLDGGEEPETASRATMLRLLLDAATKLRERRRAAGAILTQRREPKIRVDSNEIEIKIVDNNSPSRQLVAEFMVLSNYAAAHFATERHIPIIYRVQPGVGGAPSSQRPRLSLYPEFHAGVGLQCYAQASSPIRRYMDLVLQRQLMATLTEGGPSAYQPDDLLRVLAGAEAAEADGRELERHAKRYWILRYLKRHAVGQPLEAIVLRDGSSAELGAYAVRGALRGAPNVASNARVLVQIARVEPVRGWLTLDYLSTIRVAADDSRR